MGNPYAKKVAGVFGIILLFCFPLTARADAGTPLMWAGMLHLLFGNAIIGIFEGLILAWAFKLRKVICVLIMIPANYFSAWVGYAFLNQEISSSLPFNLYNAWRWIWVMVLITYLMTLILEWPFVFFCFLKQQNRLKKSIQGNLLVNSLSYILLFGWYWLPSGTSLYTRMNVVRPSEIGFPKEGIVYYISQTNSVYKLDLGLRQTEKVCALQADQDDRLFVKESIFDMDHWDILDSEKKTLICSNLQVAATPSWRDTNSYNGKIEGTWFNFGEAPKLGAADTSDWSFETGFWPIEGFRGENKKTRETLYFSLETPFVAWAIRDATHLPGDYIVFQLGDDQICLLEVNTKKIALLANGQGPVVVMPINSKN